VKRTSILALADAFRDRDRERVNGIAADLYGVRISGIR
jgi:hypothetical protein